MAMSAAQANGVRVFMSDQEVAIRTTLYERGGSLKVIFDAGAGASSLPGTTASGFSNVFAAFKSGPVNVSQASTRAGVASRQSSTSSRSDSRSRLSRNTQASPSAALKVAATSRYGTRSLRAKSARKPSALIGYESDSIARSSTRPRAHFNAQA